MIKPSQLIESVRYALQNLFGYIWGKCGVLWTAAAQKALEKKYASDPEEYSEYKMGAQHGSRWIGHKVVDCANLVRWAMKQHGVDSVHSGSNLIFSCDLSASGQLEAGQRTDGKPLLPGSLVFTGTKGNHPHVGVYVGDGNIIEAYGTKEGVVETSIMAKLKAGGWRWTWWGELKTVDYSAENAPVSPSAPAGDESQRPYFQPVKKGQKGAAVRDIQAALIAAGYKLPKYGIDGDFGNETLKAVQEFQQDHGLPVTGIVDGDTWAALDGAEPVKKYTAIIPNLTEAQADALIKQYPGAIKEERGND